MGDSKYSLITSSSRSFTLLLLFTTVTELAANYDIRSQIFIYRGLTTLWVFLKNKTTH